MQKRINQTLIKIFKEELEREKESIERIVISCNGIHIISWMRRQNN